MPQLDFLSFPSQMFWMVIFFCLQYIVISKLIAPTLSKIFKSRTHYINNCLSKAEKLSAEAEKLRYDYENKLDELEKENAKLFEKESLKIQVESEKKLAVLEKTFTRELKESEKHFEIERQNMKAALDKAVITLSMSLINKVVNAKPTKDELAKYL